MDKDDVFRALADENRRTLLDLLFRQDGQTLTELAAHLPMTRFGVMKHLQILEEAGLVTTRKTGREKFHYLNPVPIQLVYDRWVSKYARPWTDMLAGLKTQLEENKMGDKVTHVLQVFIRTTPDQLWRALTDGNMTRQYYFESIVESSWQPGATYRNRNKEGQDMIRGEVLEADPPHRLVTTFTPCFVPGWESFTPSKVVWEIEQTGPACKLTLTHSEIDMSQPASDTFFNGWSQILSGLKTLLETGEPLQVG